MTEFGRLLPVLIQGNVRFILIGGVAAAVHGSARATFDIDVVYDRDPQNIERLVRTMQEFKPYPRGAPEGLPFSWSVESVRNGLNFTLTTSIGSIDLFGEIVGGGGYKDLLPDAKTIAVFGVQCLCLSVDRLIQVKRAAGRPKDLEVVAELEAIRNEQKNQRETVR